MAKAYPTLCLDPFPAFYVPTGARAAACVTAASVNVPSAAVTAAVSVRLGGPLANPNNATIMALRAAGGNYPQLYFFIPPAGNAIILSRVTTGGQFTANFLTAFAPVVGTTYRLVATVLAGTITFYVNGALISSGNNFQMGGPFTALDIGVFSAFLPSIGNLSASGVVLANHAWSAAEVAADLANANPPGLIVGGGQYLQPGMLYAQTPDATGNSLALPPPTGGRVVPDVIHTGVVRAGSLQPLAGQSTVGVQGAVFDAAGLLQAGGLKHISATVGTTQVAVAHGLGRVPAIILFFERSNATSWQSATADATNVYLTASVAGTSVDLYVA